MWFARPRSHWITNAGVEDAGRIINNLKASKDWKGFRILPGTPMATKEAMVKELRGQKIVGIYAVSDKPVMKEHVRNLKALENKQVENFLKKLDAHAKAWELLRT